MKPPVSSPAVRPKEATDGFAAGRPSGLAAFSSEGIRVHLDLPPAALSPNARAHWAAKSRAAKVYRESCAWSFRLAKPRGWVPQPIVIDVEYRATRGCGGAVCYDEDNARACLKSGLDGLIDAGIIPTDSAKWLRWGSFTLVTTKRSAAWKARGDGVTITIRSRA